ncbi:cytoplasmic dynein 2 intermediate chain 1 isoform X3 [Tachysurus fulvidraco]|uniref:cytoplasmic dynein 2 intermediate chain 1 isoform X3 n=1 Tax=Tachysurus fulvidraco TaxID=1234273 RepID=UPI001FEFCA25|nr:cytoplasmic dynein 2 intermediate chain 1 isoform X3 [Tachysurus fulvidraco]
MYSGKKITKEDTWRPDDLIRHIQSQEEESGRKERSHRDPERERRKHREESARRGEARDERVKESNRDRGETQYREREKERDGERERERVKRNREKERNKERDREKDRERDLERERERVKERDRGKDTEREKRNREKERDKEKDREREKRDREKDREREKRYGEKVREKEKRDREKPREKERDSTREAVRDLGEEKDREKDRERERRRAEREKERRKEKDFSLDVEDKSREREKDRKERHREREHRRGGEERERGRREHERRETHGHRQHMGQTDGEDRREQRRREKEQHEDKVIEQRHRRQDGDRVREREERNKRDQRHTDSNQRDREHESAQRKTLQEVERDVTKDSHQGAKDSGNEDYEDDFEKMDYEEDFEEFDEDREEEEEEKREVMEEEEVREDKSMEVRRELSPHSRREVEAIQRAMEQENELLSTAHSISSTQESEISLRVSVDSESHSRKSRAYGRVIDFTAARQREINQQASDKQKKRSVELLRLIDLDFSVTECLLDLPPVREYDLYMKSYGMANTKQAYVQCNEDNMERDTQTDETDMTDVWTQHPPESSVACGGPQVSQNASDVTRTTVDSKRLAAFLRSATQVMAVLLEENIAESKTEKLQSQTHTYSFSEGCVQLNTKLNILQGRQVKLLHFSQTQTHTLLSVHAPCSRSYDVTIDSKTMICVWNIWEPSTPQRILFYEAEVRSCCFSPGKATLVFAGTDVGSVLVWDLREHSGSHLHIRVCEEEWTLRHPTFSTDAVLSGVGHFSPIVSVEPVLVNVGAGLRDPLLPEQEESLGLSFQLGSLDENGLLNLWVVVELPKADYSGSQTDLGLHPGGKVKLLHSSSLQTTPGVDKRILGVTSHLSFVLKFLPSDSNHYFIGSNMGLVRHGTRHGLRAVPKLYRPKCGERPAEVTALEFCPAGEPFFLVKITLCVGCSDGSVRLHTLACDEAVCEWTVGSGHSFVQCVQFSPTRRSVFCALDSASVLHIWDLTQTEESPLITQDLHTDPVSAMALFGDTAMQNPYSGVALAKHSGRLEIHFLLPSLTIPQAMDAEKLHSLTRDTL